MGAQFMRLTTRDVPALPVGHWLVLNPSDRIVTLIGPESISAQCRFSNSAFRLLFLLLRSPYGANYAELLACLRCSETVFRNVFQATSYEDALAILAPQINRWNKHLERSAQQGNVVLERELKIVRRAAKERHGVNSTLQQHGFALTVKAMYRKGYLLTRTSSSKY